MTRKSTTRDTTEQSLRKAMVVTARQLDARGLNRGTSGNIGVRVGRGLLVTPSGVNPMSLKPSSMVLMDTDGQNLGRGVPSSEWRIHRDIFVARADVGAVVHTHSTFAATLCVHRKSIPAFHYMIAVAGGDSIRCAPYALFGTQALSDGVIKALKDRRACLMANHGLVALGSDLSQAVAVAIEVESLCEMYWRALQLGEPHILGKSEMDEVIERFKHYGQHRAL